MCVCCVIKKKKMEGCNVLVCVRVLSEMCVRGLSESVCVYVLFSEIL